MKIVGIGYPKTGTTTLAKCLRLLGYNHCGWSEEIYDAYARGEMQDIWRAVESHDSFDNFPWPALYQEIDKRYPGSKFILTTRAQPDAWIRSLHTHAHRRPAARVWHILGMRRGEFDAEMAERQYLAHNDEVRRFFSKRPHDFIEVCWESGDAWQILAPFLGQPLPSVPFPHANKTPTTTQFIVKEIKKKLKRPIK